MRFSPLLPKRYCIKGMKLGLLTRHSLVWGIFDRELDAVNVLCLCANLPIAKQICDALNATATAAHSNAQTAD